MSGIQKEEDDLFKPGTVLFTQGGTLDSDVWDDSELIEHWDRTIEAYRRYTKKNTEKPPPFQQSNKLKVKKGSVKTKSVKKSRPVNKVQTSNRIDNTFSQKENEFSPETMAQPQPEVRPFVSLPPMPASSNQEDLSNLMMAWYYCGYYTGLYAKNQ